MKTTKTKKRVARKAATKKRRSNKAPSAKQLAARAKFAAAAKARSKKAAKKRTRNKTVIIKPKRVLVVNGKRTRRKYRNGYLDLVIRGTAEKTAQGWKVGRKTIPQGKGIAPISSGYYLDKATGTIFAKRARNAFFSDKSSSKCKEKKSWLTGKRKSRCAETEKPALLKHWAKTGVAAAKSGAFEAAGKIAGATRKLAQRNSAKASPKVRQLRETFTGTTSRKTSTMNVADGTPTNLAKLGKLVLVKAEGGTIKPASGTTWLCADAKGKLYFATSAERLYDGPAQNFGEVSQIEYEAIKPHLGHKRPTIFFHKMGEKGGKRPVLIGDGKGGLKLRGGSYKIQREGIVN